MLDSINSTPTFHFLRNSLKIEGLKMDDWKLHKQLIQEGVIPSDIARAIRNDDVEKLQEISSQTNFDFNQCIEPSIYERCSYINNGDVSLIDYAAFFGSIKCFRFLFFGSKINSSFKYAIVWLIMKSFINVNKIK